MNSTEQTFPLPDFEVQKLDEIREQLVADSSGGVLGFIRSHAWTVAAIAAAVGIVAGLACRKKA